MRKGHRFQVLGYIIILFALLSTVTCTLYPTFAADSTPSADVKAKLQELEKEIASKAAQLKQVINQKLKDKAYIGSVKASSETSLTIAAESGPKMVSINQDTVFESNVKKRTKFFAKNISTDDYVAALGDIDETGVLTAKKVILLPTSNPQPKTYLWGQVIAISDQLITLKNKDLKNVAVSLPNEPRVKLNDFVILTGSKNKNDIFEAGFSFVIPQGGVLKPKKIATPSAQTATKSASPSAKKK